jgi:hypothetical protein
MTTAIAQMQMHKVLADGDSSLRLTRLVSAFSASQLHQHDDDLREIVSSRMRFKGSVRGSQ